jgi:L-iditol 2-dehydrogenase
VKAAVLYGIGDLRYEEMPVPKINEDEILVKVNATGICGSDFPRVLGDQAHYYPIVLGHEFAGDVVAVGNKVSNVKPGDRIAGAPLIPCHQCNDCVKGHYSLCKNYSFVGSRAPGSWAEYVKLPALNAVKLSDRISSEQGAFFEPATVALHGLLVMDFHGGSEAVILGMGTIGLLTLQCARLLGAKRIIALDIDQSRLDLASKLGADVCLNPKADGFMDRIFKESDGAGFEWVIDAAGTDFTEKLCLKLASNKGKVLFIGTPNKEITFAPPEFENILRKELTLRGSWMSYSSPFPGKEWQMAVSYFSEGKIQCEPLIDRITPLAEIGNAFRDLAVPGRVKGKIILKG